MSDFNDFQLRCATHGTVALIASETTPALARCMVNNCGETLDVIDSGAYCAENYQ